MKQLSILLILIVAAACSSSSEEAAGPVFVSNGYALDGYDPVAYFEQAEAKKGSVDETVEYNGSTYCFSSTKNRSLFESDPEKYLPAYGGWCAYAVAERSTRMAPDPTEWQIQDGELQFFTTNFMTKVTGSLRNDWNEDPDDYKTRADDNWDQMK